MLYLYKNDWKYSCKEPLMTQGQNPEKQDDGTLRRMFVSAELTNFMIYLHAICTTHCIIFTQF